MNGISRQLLDDITTKDSTNSTENNDNDGKNCNKTKEKMANGSSPDTALDLFDNSMETFAKILSKIHITPVTELTSSRNANNDYQFLDKSEQDKSEQDNPKLLFRLGLGNPKPNETVQVKSKQDKPEQHELEQDESEKSKPEQDISEKDKLEQNKTQQDKIEQNEPEQGKSEHDKPEQSTVSTTLVHSTPICVLKELTGTGETDTTLNTSEDKTLQDLKNTDKFKSDIGGSQSNAPFTCKALASVGDKFDKGLLMSLYTFNLGTATIQTSETIAKKTICSFPFRDKRAALALKYQSLNSIQKRLPSDSNEFKATILSFSAAEKSMPSFYVFGSEKIIATIFNKEPTSQCIPETPETTIDNNDFVPVPTFCTAQESGYFSMADPNATSVNGFEGETSPASILGAYI